MSMSVPVVLNEPSRNELSMNRFVSSCLSFSSLIRATRSFSFFSWTNLRQSSSILVEALTVSMKCSISSFLLRSWMLELTALSIETRMLLSSQLDAWYLATSRETVESGQDIFKAKDCTKETDKVLLILFSNNGLSQRKTLSQFIN